MIGRYTSCPRVRKGGVMPGNDRGVNSYQRERGPVIEIDRKMPALGNSVAKTPNGSPCSFRLDPELLDDRPPFFGISLYQRPKRLLRLFFARKNLHSEVEQPRSHRRIG